jgi:alkylhydroperoxidase family enzyme
VSWLTNEPTDRAGVLSLRPELAEAHERLHAAIWDSPIPSSTLELCRLRMAELLQCAPALAERSPRVQIAKERIEHLAQWPTNPMYSNDERTCLEFAELFVIDQHAITDGQADAVRRALGEPGFVAFTTALAIWENQHRLDNALGVQ